MNITALQIISHAAAFVCGAIICWLLMRSKWRLLIQHEQTKADSALKLSEQQCEKLQEFSLAAHKNLKKLEHHNRQYIERNKALTAEAAIAQQLKRQTQEKQQEINDLRHKLSTSEQNHNTAQTTIAELITASKHQKHNAEEKLQLLHDNQAALKEQFVLLANDIFEAKQKHHTQQSRQHLDAILNPFNKQLQDFKDKIEQTHHHDGQQHAALLVEIKNLRELNHKLNKEAVNLTRALKGDKQKQGAWGELILTKALEQSGLREGHEYHTQTSFNNQQKQTFRPDAIIHLPHGHDVIVDSKVSLVDYEQYVSTAAEQDKQQALKQHINAIKQHIKGLGDKDYSSLKGIDTLDFVLMFMPIEAAFVLAIDHQPSLLNDAFEHKIIIVTPTTLLATLKTIENLWRYEKQNVHAREIANKAGLIYDKLRGFVEDIEKLGKQLDSSQNTYHEALNKLTQGKGNLVNQAQQLLGLGVKVKKHIPDTILQQSEIDKP